MSLSVGIDFIASILASVFKELRNINTNKNRSTCCIVNINNYQYQLQGHKVSPKQEIQTLNHLYIPHDINVSSLQSFLIVFVFMHWRACSLIPSALSLNINTTFLPRGINKVFLILNPLTIHLFRYRGRGQRGQQRPLQSHQMSAPESKEEPVNNLIWNSSGLIYVSTLHTVEENMYISGKDKEQIDALHFIFVFCPLNMIQSTQCLL